MELKGNSSLPAAWRLICRIKQTPNTYWDDNGLSKALERGVLGKTVPKISTAEIKHIMYSAKITKPGSLPHPFPPLPSRDSGSSALAWFRGRRRSEMGWCRGRRGKGAVQPIDGIRDVLVPRQSRPGGRSASWRLWAWVATSRNKGSIASNLCLSICPLDTCKIVWFCDARYVFEANILPNNNRLQEGDTIEASENGAGW